jgi:hypothetical protein
MIVGVGWTTCLGPMKKSKPDRIKYLASLPGNFPSMDECNPVNDD